MILTPIQPNIIPIVFSFVSTILYQRVPATNDTAIMPFRIIVDSGVTLRCMMAVSYRAFACECVHAGVGVGLHVFVCTLRTLANSFFANNGVKLVT